MFTYPQQDLDRPEYLASLLGSFWSGTYGGADQVEAFAAARAQLEKQTVLNLAEAIDATSRFKVPVFHTETWYQLVLRESAMNPPAFTVPKYGEPFVYGPQTDTEIIIRYGEPADKGVFAFPQPANLRNVLFIANRTDLPSISWTSGLDFILEDGYLQFRHNPFDNAEIPVRPVYEDGVEVDREAALWLFRSEWDADFVWTHFGHVLGFDLPSSPAYRDALNSLWDTLILGGQLQSVEEFLAAVADAPLAKGDETVEYVLKDSSHLLVITDQNAYVTNHEALPSVGVGDELSAGQPVSDAIAWYQPNRAQTPPDWLVGYTLDENFLGEEYPGGVTFIRQLLPTTVDTSGAYTEIRFPLGGKDATVEAFWDEVQARGIATDATLAQLMDTRTDATNEPPAGALPSEINPLYFLLEQMLRGSSLFVSIKPQSFGPRALPLSALRLLRRMASPYEALLFILQLGAVEDPPTPNAGTLVTYIELTALVEDPPNYAPLVLLPPSYVDGICL